MTTRSQTRKAVAELVSGEFETSTTENNQPENLLAGPSKSLRVQPENLDEIKTSLRKEIMSDLTKILAENQKEMMKLVAPITKKSSAHQNAQDSDSETENISVARTSIPVKTNTTAPKNTPKNSRNNIGENFFQKAKFKYVHAILIFIFAKFNFILAKLTWKRYSSLSCAKWYNFSPQNFVDLWRTILVSSCGLKQKRIL